MKGGKVNDFIEDTMCEECAVMYENKKYFFHGLIFDERTETYSYSIDLWDENDDYVKTVFDEKAKSKQEIMEKFYSAKIWNGKTFYEAETEMNWIDW